MSLSYENILYGIGILVIAFFVGKKIKDDPESFGLFILRIVYIIGKFIKLIVVLILGAIYIIFPIDFIPDVLPFFGWLDDLGVGLFMYSMIRRVRRG